MRKIKIEIEVPEEEYKKLKKICDALNISIDDVFQKMTKTYIKDLLEEFESIL
ncbi:MAG: hypothetical protein BAJALOKI2v1_210056 [Promethearchaeota archaeon]|nr:MAG: hypothetical protein BAJALOKI2v1_210056 [Candidatus Lokiarchaeota archaeon]